MIKIYALIFKGIFLLTIILFQTFVIKEDIDDLHAGQDSKCFSPVTRKISLELDRMFVLYYFGLYCRF